MKVWISKYALTRGLMEVKVRECGNGMVKTLGSRTMYYHKGDWHRTREDAVTKATVLRARKLVSMRKALAKLEAMTF